MRQVHQERYPVFFSLFLAIIFMSCAHTRSVRTKIFEDRRTNVTLREWVDRDNKQVDMKYNQPVDFALDELKYLLGSVAYQEKTLFGWSDVKRVFTADELYRTTPYLVTAFKQADGGSEVMFRLHSAKPGLIFSAERISDGIMFVRDGKLNCLFSNIDMRSETDLYEGNPRKYYAGALWSLVANDWQELVEDEGGIHHNWIEIDIKQGLAEKRQVENILQRKLIRKRIPPQRKPQLAQPENWNDWDTDNEVEVQPLPDVYFPDELPPGQQE
jgi:hypothetical protein